MAIPSSAILPFLSFVACISDHAVLRSNLLASSCLGPESSREVIVLKNCPSAAAGLNIGLERAKHDWVVCVHQDVYLPEGWDRLLMNQLRQAEQWFGPIGVAGVYGVGEVISPQSQEIPLMADRIGWVVDRGRYSRMGRNCRRGSRRWMSCCLCYRGIRRFGSIRAGFHLYGADICLQARERGLAVVAIGCCAITTRGALGCRRRFLRRAEVFARKWATSCRWPRHASSSTATGGFTCSATRNAVRHRKTNTFLTTEGTENTEEMRRC